ncbi:MAG: PEGA domain-containing protein [Deltaproteobacteria bacterium]|nr:PEGA domain-containing protein [Deltaproteobacteria bacterium]
MSEHCIATGPSATLHERFFGVVCALLAALPWAPSTAHAQPSASAGSYALVTSASDDRASERAPTFERRVRRLARRQGLRLAPMLDEGRMGSPVPAQRVAAFSRVVALLAEADALASGLREGAALARLAEAERLVREHADVPGAARWLAEVRVRVGVVALASSLDDLGRSALSDAATLDPSRVLGSAEAPPTVVDRARRIALAVAARPTGHFRVLADGPFATVYLDDQPLGPAPASVVVPAGRHLLRVESRGYLPWGRVIDVFEGHAPDLRVRLSPGPELRARRALVAAAEGHEASQLPHALANIGDLGPSEIWLLELGDGPQARALLTRCSRRGCRAPLRLREGHALAEPADHPLTPRALRRAHAWLEAERPPPPPPTPLYRRPGVWLGVALAVVGASVAAALLTRPAPRQTLVIEPRPGDL